jgi:asparagine synthase (glutamine-hydrolysing)
VRFVSDSDTEVLLQAFIRWGEAAFDRFNGMWAFAIWDAKERVLTLSRDRFGIKPLYYALHAEVLYFASEIKFIRAMLPATTLDPVAAARYVRSAHRNVDERTFWNEVRELEPGCCATFRDGRLDVRRWWTYEPAPERWTEADALARFGELFEDSLKLRMRSDVEVGTLLSGGLDSTTIVCALDRLGLISGGTFKSFSAVFEEEAFSERRYLDLTLARVPVVPYLVFPKAEELTGYLPELLYHNEEPVRSLSVYSQYLIYKTVRGDSNVKVVLNGQGADELFGGYLADYWVLMGALLKDGRVGQALAEAKLLRERRGIDWKTTLVAAAKNTVKALGHRDWFTDAGFEQVRRSALRGYLAYDDRNSAAWGIEARVPFLDYRMVEFAFSLDRAFKISEFENKCIERAYARGLVPDEIVDRTDKMGFVSPQEVWQRGVLKPELDRVLPRYADTRTASLVDDPRIAEGIRRYLAGDDAEWGLAWRVYCLERWMEEMGA